MNTKFDFNICEKNTDLFKYQNKKNTNALKAKDNIFSMILPPPNLTGILHVGHALNCTVQDFIFRYNSLKGLNSIWFSGMDHAGIATQTKYESFLKNSNKSNLLNNKTRNEKIMLLNEWAQENADKIRKQWKELGLFLDYEHERFTLDKKSNELVIKTFVDLYNDGLIYRGYKLVNWDVKLKTAVSNIEVIKKEVNKKMFYIKYFLENKTDFLIVATTRPETIFVDSAVFVNDTDKRYKKYIGKKVINPLTNKLIPILSDNYIDKKFGTGVMKCTPAHDFNDYELGKKYKLESLSCIDYDGKMNDNANQYKGIDRLECSKLVVDFFKKNNLLIKEEDTISNVGYSERSNEIIEPLLSEQWFIKMDYFAEKIIKLQSSKNKLVFYPTKFEKTLINWVKNIDDWCISRQLWWGHQIPAWYHKKTNKIFVGIKPPKDIENWIQDSDVLDTWFSSGLWPITCTQFDSEIFFPTDVLVTGYDIIFFWIVRMILFSLYLKKEPPFKNVYVTGLIRDEIGRKMSKSLGNGIDPQQVIKEKGADTLRLMLLTNSHPGEDVRLSLKETNNRIDLCWTFLNKLWNSFRYILEYKSIYSENYDEKNFLQIDYWIINKFFKMYNSVKVNFKKYNLIFGLNHIIDFFKNDYCNTYLELNKNRDKKDINHIYILFYVMKNILILLHPACPYITSYLYDMLPNKTCENIIFEKSDFVQNIKGDNKLINDSLKIIEHIRRIKFDNKLSKKDHFEIAISTNKIKNLEKQKDKIKLLLESENIFVKEINSNSITNKHVIFDEFSIVILNSFKKDENNISELQKKLKFLESEVNRSEQILNNKSFLEKAPKEKVSLEKKKYEDYKEKLKKVKIALNIK